MTDETVTENKNNKVILRDDRGRIMPGSKALNATGRPSAIAMLGNTLDKFGIRQNDFWSEKLGYPVTDEEAILLNLYDQLSNHKIDPKLLAIYLNLKYGFIANQSVKTNINEAVINPNLENDLNEYFRTRLGGIPSINESN